MTLCGRSDEILPKSDEIWLDLTRSHQIHARSHQIRQYLTRFNEISPDLVRSSLDHANFRSQLICVSGLDQLIGQRSVLGLKTHHPIRLSRGFKCRTCCQSFEHSIPVVFGSVPIKFVGFFRVGLPVDTLTWTIFFFLKSMKITRPLGNVWVGKL